MKRSVRARRARRGGPRRVRRHEDLLRQVALHILGEPRPDPGHASRKRHRTQYRSAIYTTTAAQQVIAQQSLAEYQRALEAVGYGRITTEIKPAGPFYYAEGYHQQYLQRNRTAIADWVAPVSRAMSVSHPARADPQLLPSDAAVAAERALVSPLTLHSSRSCSARWTPSLPFACLGQLPGEARSCARLHASPGRQLRQAHRFGEIDSGVVVALVLPFFAASLPRPAPRRRSRHGSWRAR